MISRTPGAPALRGRRRPTPRLVVAALALSAAAACFEGEPAGPVTEVYAQGIVYGVVRTADGTLVPGAEISAQLYPIDRTQLESGSCVGTLTAGPQTLSGTGGRYRVAVNGYLGRDGVGCVRLTVRPPADETALAQAVAEYRDVKYTISQSDSVRLDVVLPAAP